MKYNTTKAREIAFGDATDFSKFICPHCQDRGFSYQKQDASLVRYSCHACIVGHADEYRMLKPLWVLGDKMSQRLEARLKRIWKRCR